MREIMNSVLRAGASSLAILVGSFAISTPATAQSNAAADEVIATGTLIRRTPQEDRATPVVSLGEAAISSTGAKSIADLTQTLTINTGAENNPDAFTQNSTTGTTNINLRGLGVQSTLVLLNGRRQVLSAATTNGGFNFVDTASLVPLIAVENLEILKDGASATYGSDAVAGVANFTTYQNYDGIKLNAQYQTVDGEGSSDEVILQGMFGKNFDRGNIMAAVSYTDRSPLTTAERRLSRPQDDTSALGNPGAFVPLGGPVPAGTPLLDPGCAAAGGFPNVIVPGAALGLPLDVGLCGFDFGSFFNLIAEEERLTSLVQANFDLTDTISWDAEFTYADNEAIRGNSPTFPFLVGGVVPADHPNTIFAGPLAALAPGGAVFLGRAIGNGGQVSPNLTTSETWRISTGLEGVIGDKYDWRVSYTQAENNHVVNTEDTIASTFRCALDGFRTDACSGLGVTSGTFFNPFSSSFSTAPNDPAVLDAIIGTQVRDLTSEVQVIEGVVSGEIGDSGAAAAIGVQYRKEDYTAAFDATSNADDFGFLIGEQDFSGEQDIFAVFGEVNVPLGEMVELQGALRYEDYGSSVGSTLDPKVAILFRPADYLSVRGSFSTSFRAPTAYQQFGQQTALNQVADPNTGGNVFAGVRTFGNENLSPEQSEAFNVGFTWTGIENLKLEADLFKFNFSDVIIAENFQSVVNADPNDETRVVRNAGGSIVQVNTNFVNASSVVTSGIDFGLSYTLESDLGTFVPFIQGTYVFAYDLDDPQAGSVDGVGNRNFTNFGTSVPQTRFNTGFNWILDSHRLDIFGRYISGYDDDQNAGTEIDSHFTVDARYSLNIGDYFDALGEGTALNIGVINAFNEDPPQVFTNGGFDSKVHDPRGRLLYAGIDIEF
jgi:iron complex outermembrane receptor protein